MKSSGLAVCTGYEELPTLGKSELRKLFQGPDKDYHLVAVAAQYHYQDLPSFSERGIGKKIQAF